MRTVLYAAGAFALTLLLSAPAHAFCLNPAADSRLQVYCLSKALAGTATTFQSAQMLDFRIKREGYANGIGLPGTVKSVSFSPYVSPLLEYSSDINGGNPNRPLVLGSLTFFGDPEFFRKKGVVAGVGVGGAGRAMYGEGKYLDYNFGISYAHSPEHDIGIARGFANVCSKNDIGRNYYLDGCLTTSQLNRDLINERTSSATLSIAKLFSKGGERFNQASFGVRRFFDEEYEQNQVVMRLDTLHQSGFYTGLTASFGEAITETLTMRHSFSATLGKTFLNKPVSATFSYSFSDGGRLLGFERDEMTRFINVTYTVHPLVKISIGYKDTSSSIDYFDESEAILGIQFAPIRF